MSPSPRKRTAIALGAVAVAGGVALLAARARAAREATGPLVPGLEPRESFDVTSADGTRIHVDEFGPADGQPLVLVHAWMCCTALWHRQIAELAGEYRVIAMDLRGHGASGLATTMDYSIEAFAHDLDAVLGDRLGGGQRAVIAGHSMGAMTIAAWAHGHPASVPDRCSAVAMIGTGLGDLVSESLVVRAPARFNGTRERLEAALLRTEVPFDTAPELTVRTGARLVAFGSDPRPDDVALVARMVRECPRRVRGRSGGTLSRLEVHDGLAHLDVPAAVVAGAEDKMTPPIHCHKLAGMLPSRPEVIEVQGSGHMVPLEAHEIVSSELRRLLEETGPRKPGRPRRAAATS